MIHLQWPKVILAWREPTSAQFEQFIPSISQQKKSAVVNSLLLYTTKFPKVRTQGSIDISTAQYLNSSMALFIWASALSRSFVRGPSLMSGGDIDIAYTACKKGLGKGVFPELTLDHLISKERVRFKYVKELIEMSSCSFSLLRVSHGMHPTLKLSSGKGGILRMLYLCCVPKRKNRLRVARERGFRRGERLARPYGN